MRRMLTMATVHFQARVREESQARLVTRMTALGIPYHVAITALKRIAHERCRETAAALYDEAAGWSVEQWAQVREVREAQVTPC